MTPLGQSTFYLILDLKMTPSQKRGAAWQLWEDYGLSSCMYASRFAAKCLYAVTMWSEPGRSIDPPPPSSAQLGGMDQDLALTVGSRTWNYLAGVVAEYDMGVKSPTGAAELADIAASHEGAAVQLFGHWGWVSMDDLSRNLSHDAFAEAYDWTERELGRLDREMAEEGPAGDKGGLR